MARRPLARVYRPQRFSEVLGQEVPVRALSRAAASGQVASCFIFSGTRGIGKTTIARLFAKALICEKGPAEDCCNECTPCREVTEGRCMDLLELDAATHTGIDDVRELREAAQYPPTRDRYRLFILDEAHQLSSAAWNGLLKVLEEPPAWCVFMFCTTEPHKIPPTIESRALHFAFKSPVPSQIKRYLGELAAREKLQIDEEALGLLAEAANGSVRDGLSALDQVRALAGEKIDAAAVRQALGLISSQVVIRYMLALAEADAPAALQLIAALDEEGQDLRSFAVEALAMARRLALSATLGIEAVPLPEGIAAETVERLGVERLLWTAKVLDEIEARLRQGGPARLLFDLATIRIVKLSELPDLGSLLERLAKGGAAPTTLAAPGQPPAPRTPSGRGAAPPPTSSVEAALSRPSSPLRTGGEFRRHLLDAVIALRPSLASCATAIDSSELKDDGTLCIRLAAGREVWIDKLQQPQEQAALLQATQRISGVEAKRIEILTGDPSQLPKVASRKQILEQARTDPTVRALFDQFGAVVLDGQPLEPREE